MGTNFDYNNAKDPLLRVIFAAIDTAISSVVAGVVADGSITNLKLATDVKVGSLTSLTTAVKTSVQAAINELDSDVGDLSSLTTTVKTSLVAALNEVDGDIGDISTLTTTLKTSMVAALNELDGDIGALSSLTTTEKGSVVGAVNELDSGKYEKPGSGIPATDLETAAQTNLGLAATAVQGTAAITKIIKATIQLSGYAKTRIGFQSDTAGYIDGGAGPYDLSGVGDGGTIIATADGNGAETATLNCAAGYHTGGVGASVDMSAAVDDKFMLSVDGAAAVEVECDFIGAACNDGTKIAAEMQSKARTATGTLLTVAYSAVGGDHYTLTSPTLGTDSSIEVTAATDHNCTEELKIGTADGGADTAGTGDCGDVTAVSVDEIVTLINGDMSNVTASNESGSLRVTSDTTGRLSRVVAGNGTHNTALGIPNTETGYGKIGLGETHDMNDTAYVVHPSLKGSGATDQTIAWDDPQTDGFYLVPLTNTAVTDYVGVSVLGVQAS